jgi:hypothetical protein
MSQTTSFAGVEIDQKKAKLIKFAIIGACCIVAAPAALVVLKGVIALAVAGAVAAGSIFFAPVIAHKMSIQRIKAVVKDAEENPIETLQAEYIQMKEDADQFQQEVTSYAAEVSNFAQQTREFAGEYPEDARMFEEQLAAYQANQAFKEEKYKQALADLRTFEGVVKRAKAMWKMALSSKRMSEVDGRQSGDVFSQIRKETSLDAVRMATYQSFAEVRTALLKKDVPASLPIVSQNKLAAPSQPETIGLIGEVRQAQPVNQ